MILKAFAVRDLKGGFFHAPYYAQTHGEAERQFKKLASNQQTDVGQFPEDFDLYHVGEYDTASGRFETTQPSPVMSGAEAKIKKGEH